MDQSANVVRVLLTRLARDVPEMKTLLEFFRKFPIAKPNHWTEVRHPRPSRCGPIDTNDFVWACDFVDAEVPIEADAESIELIVKPTICFASNMCYNALTELQKEYPELKGIKVVFDSNKITLSKGEHNASAWLRICKIPLAEVDEATI